MNINRHNYETFFLLYVDNELSAADRKSVELFVQENPDLGNELLALLGTTLPDEKIKFHSKESLFKNEVDNELLQENLLLHLDNELDPLASDKIKALIASDAVIASEWNILQQTKLSANDEIIFQNKNILYRHERGRVISINFWRVAAAAAILLICLFTVVSLLKNNKTGEDKIAKGTTKPSTEKQIPDNSNIVSKNNSLDSVKTIVPENIVSVDDKEKIKKENKVAPVVIKQKETQNKNEIASHDKLLDKEKNILPKSPLEKINNEESNKTNSPIVLNKNNEIVIKNKTPDEVAITKSSKDKITAPTAPIIDYESELAKPDNNSFAKTAVLDEKNSNDNKILYMNEETVSRSRIGGLFRKVKRIVERNTNIKTGNGIRVAGFEIAVK